jgi:hypothetical protein
MCRGQNIHFQDSLIVVHDATNEPPIWNAIATDDDHPPAVVFMKHYGPAILDALDSLNGSGEMEPITAPIADFAQNPGIAQLILTSTDMDGDGDDDVVGFWSNYSLVNHECQLFEYRRDGLDWIFLCLGQYMTPWNFPYWQFGTIALFDVDDDGDQDILFKGIVEEAMGGFYQESHDIALFQQSDHSFVETISLLPVADYFVSHDLDQDGRPELFVHQGDSTFVLHNEGAGDFSPMDTLFLGTYYSFDWADATGDGLDDLMHNSFTSQQWSLEAYPVTDGTLGEPLIVFSYPVSADSSISYAV